MALASVHKEGGVRLHRQVARGFPYSEFVALRRASGLSTEEALNAVGISRRTLGRRRRRGRFVPHESERILRVRRVVDLAVDVLEARDRAHAWLRRRNVGLGGEVPLALLSTDPGVREVEYALRRIQGGVYA